MTTPHKQYSDTDDLSTHMNSNITHGNYCHATWKSRDNIIIIIIIIKRLLTHV